MACIITPILVSLADSADIPLSNVFKKRQAILFHKATFLDPKRKLDITDPLRKYITKSDTITDVCAYLGVQCENDVVETLNLCNVFPSAVKWTVRLEWLPPGMKHIHLNAVRFQSGLKFERLPRALRYLFLRSCKWTGGARQEMALNFRKLPPHMEELVVYKGNFAGKIERISCLPETMRFILLRSDHIRGKVYVDKSALPASMERLAVCGAGLGAGVLADGDSACVVSSTYDLREIQNDSRYYHNFRRW